MTRRLGAALAATVTVFALTSCSSDESADESSPSESTEQVDEAAGDVVETETFSYTVPDGWAEQEEPRALSVAADQNDDDGFTDNINVVEDPMVAQMQGDELSDAIVTALEDAGVGEVRVREATTVGGKDAVHVAAVFEIQGNRYRTEQFGIQHAGTGYVITFSHSLETTEEERDAVDDSILATWEWK